MSEATARSEAISELVAGGNSFAVVPDWVLRNCLLDGGDIQLYAWLALVSDAETNTTTRLRKTLANELECSPKTIDRRLAKLEHIGAIRIQRRYRPHSFEYAASTYEVKFVRE